jgi:CHAD domain-containing protein
VGRRDTAPVKAADASAGEVVHAALARGVERLAQHAEELRTAPVEGGNGVEAVHQARVATRRLRSDLRTFGDLLDEDWARSLRSELAELAEVLGVVRDIDVLTARLERSVGHLDKRDRSAAAFLFDELVAQRRAGMTLLLARLGTPAHEALMEHLKAMADAPRYSPLADEPAAAVFALVARRAWRPLAEAAERVLAEGPEQAPIEHLHQVRIRAKRFRYAADAAALVDRRAARHAKRLASLQDDLGLLNDAAVAELWLRRHVQGEPSERAFAVGQLVMLERLEIEHRRRSWVPEWRAVERAELRRWLG